MSDSPIFHFFISNIDAVRKEKETDVPVQAAMAPHAAGATPQQQQQQQQQQMVQAQQQQQAQIPPSQQEPTNMAATNQQAQMQQQMQHPVEGEAMLPPGAEGVNEDAQVGEDDLVGENEDDDDEGKKPEKRKRGPRKPKPPLTVTYVEDPKMQINPAVSHTHKHGRGCYASLPHAVASINPHKTSLSHSCCSPFRLAPSSEPLVQAKTQRKSLSK